MKKTRFFAGLLATVMLLSLLPISALAEGSSEHLTECGFVCTHVHSEECGYYVPTGENVPCAHGDDCGYVAEDVYGVCDCAAEAAVEGVVTHGETCASLTVVTAAAPCGHADGDAKETLTETPDACAHTCGGDEWVCAEGCAALNEDDAEDGIALLNVTEVDPAAAEVVASIDALVALDLFNTPATTTNEGKVRDVITAYGALTDEQKTQISDEHVLALSDAELAIVASRIKFNLPAVDKVLTQSDVDYIWRAKNDYAELTDEQKARMAPETLEKLNTLIEKGKEFIGIGYAAIRGKEQVQYDTVREAIAAAIDGDTILLNGRVYWGGDTQTNTVLNGTVTITSADANSSLIVNGADGHTDSVANVTHLVSGVIFKDVVIEESGGVNYLYAQGNYLELDNVRFTNKGDLASGEMPNGYWIFLGGSDLRDVASTEMVLGKNNANIVSAIGGGLNHDVTGDAKLTVHQVGSSCYVFGGGVQGNVGGKATVVVGSTTVEAVYGGGFLGNVGSTDVTIGGRVWVYGAYGGGRLGHVEKDTSITITANGVIDGSVYGGGSTDKQNPWNGNWRGDLGVDPSNAKNSDCYVGGNTSVTVDGTVGSVVSGGGSSAMVKGNTHVVVNGTVGTDPDWYTGVYGSGSGKTGGVGGNTYVEIAESGKVLRAVTDLGTCGGVVGGGYAGTISGDTMVVINGTVGDDILGGTVFGGGARGGDVLGTTNVVMNKAVYDAKEQKDDWFGFGAYGLGIGRVCGVFGGGFNGITSGSTNVEINVDMGAAPVYGGGVISIVKGSTAVTLNNGARAVKAVGGSQTVCPMGYQEGGTGMVMGTAAVTLKGDAAVGTIYGYESLSDKKSVTGTATVTFDSNTSTAKQIINADAVTVANASTVTIDNEGKDNDQLVNVSNLSVTGKSKLTLPASAHILGNYAGDTAEQKGTLVLSAGKGLTADGTVTNLTDISIVDTETVKPAEAQVYVVSKLGSTKTDGDFTWIDRRTGLAMEWKANTDQTSQWWLVKYTEPVDPPVGPVDPGVTTYSVTVKYVDQDGKSLASDYTTRKNAGSSYDVSAQAARAIAGYAIDRVDGAPVGTVQGNVTITVHYKSNTGEPDIEIPDVDPPLTDLPETEIPTGPTPEVPGGGDTVIVDPEVPMGNLPQTGAEAYADIPFGLAFGVLGLSLSVACVAVALKKKES